MGQRGAFDELFGDRVDFHTLKRDNCNGRAEELDEALDRFCDEWNRGTEDRARLKQEYLVAVGTRR